MARKCELCAKKSSAGGSHVHHRGVAGGQWKRRAQHTKRTIGVNLHWVTISINGAMVRVKSCAKCIKRAKFNLQTSQVAAA